MSQSPARAFLACVTLSLPSCPQRNIPRGGLRLRLPFVQPLVIWRRLRRQVLWLRQHHQLPSRACHLRLQLQHRLFRLPLWHGQRCKHVTRGPARRGRAAKPAHARAPCRRTRTTGFRATTRHHTPTNGACVRAQARGRTFAIPTGTSRRPRARNFTSTWSVRALYTAAVETVFARPTTPRITATASGARSRLRAGLLVSS